MSIACGIKNLNSPDYRCTFPDRNAPFTLHQHEPHSGPSNHLTPFLPLTIASYGLLSEAIYRTVNALATWNVRNNSFISQRSLTV